MTNWIQTKAGLQMAETITRYLPRIFVCIEEIAKIYTFSGLDKMNGIKMDIRKLADETDLRKQENTNLKFQLDETNLKLSKLVEQHSHYLDLTNDRITTLETIIEERK